MTWAKKTRRLWRRMRIKAPDRFRRLAHGDLTALQFRLRLRYPQAAQTMADSARVVIDITLESDAPLKPRELAFHLANAIEQYRREQHREGQLTIEALRIPEDTQTFIRARELYDPDAHARWKAQRPPS